MKHAIVIGYANSGRKKLLSSCQTHKLQRHLKITRVRGLNDTKEEVYEGLQQIIKQVPQTNYIIIVISYQRLDLMKKKLNLLMDHFKTYSQQIYLIISNFELSQDLEDIIEIQNRLAIPQNIKNCYAHKCENQVGYIIDCNKIVSNGFQFFQILSQTKQEQIKFDLIKMNLEIQYDEKILEMLQELVNRQEINSKQPEQQTQIIPLLEDRERNCQISMDEQINTLQIKQKQTDLRKIQQDIKTVDIQMDLPCKIYQYNSRLQKQQLPINIKQQTAEKTIPQFEFNKKISNQFKKLQNNKNQKSFIKKNFLELNKRDVATKSQENKLNKQLIRLKLKQSKQNYQLKAFICCKFK